MGKDLARKPKRRQSNKPKIDDDLIELALVLDDNRAASNLDGWLSVPWRWGWNAANLAREIWFHFAPQDARGRTVASQLTKLLGDRLAIASVYEHAGLIMDEVAALLVHGDDWARFLSASARCIQLQISKSSGGGMIYNDVLRFAIETLGRRNLLFPSDLDGLILEARCIDAIGMTAQLQNNIHDRERRAFAIAWKRGLYEAAYTIRGVRP